MSVAPKKEISISSLSPHNIGGSRIKGSRFLSRLPSWIKKINRSDIEQGPLPLFNIVNAFAIIILLLINLLSKFEWFKRLPEIN